VLEVSTSIEIDRAPDEVFDFIAEVRNNSLWRRGQRSGEWTSEPPLRVGSTYDQRVRFLGKDFGNSFEVVELEPGRGMKFASTGGSFPLTVTRRVIPLDETRSRFIEHVEGHLNRF
jgi:hypothetical protein